MIILKSSREIDRMRVACRMVAEVLVVLTESVAPGVTTYDLDRIAAEEARKRGAQPAFKGYHKYPASLCCSPNNQVIHGIPNKKPLVTGDIISLDFGILYDEYYGDAAVTLPVGSISKSAGNLLEATRKSLDEGIRAAVPGGRLQDISYAIQTYVESRGYSVVRDFVGHGIGKSLHEDPQVPNFGKRGKGVELRPGLVLAIEPMINEKGHQVRVLEDGWTAVTCDNGLSAHFEHTVAITENGPEILTLI